MILLITVGYVVVFWIVPAGASIACLYYLARTIAKVARHWEEFRTEGFYVWAPDGSYATQEDTVGNMIGLALIGLAWPGVLIGTLAAGDPKRLVLMGVSALYSALGGMMAMNVGLGAVFGGWRNLLHLPRRGGALLAVAGVFVALAAAWLFSAWLQGSTFGLR